MNYLGHAAIAALRDEPSDFVLGSMLPDLCAMSRIKLGPLDRSKVVQGVEFHIKTDAVFHQTPCFTEMNRRALADLRQMGISRGAARACAHIGVEMLIDAELCGLQKVFRDYIEALLLGERDPQAFQGCGEKEKATLSALCGHLAKQGAKVHQPTQERFQTRLRHALKGRPRLEPTDAELSTIAEYLSADEIVAPRLPKLLAELAPLLRQGE